MGQMIGYAEDFVPMIQLYAAMSTQDNQSEQQVLLNRELVERGVACWIELIPQGTAIV